MLGEIELDRHLRGFIAQCPEAETVLSSVTGWIVDELGQQQWGRAILTNGALWFYQRRFSDSLSRAISLEDIDLLRTEHKGSTGIIRVRADAEDVTIYVEEDEETALNFSEELILILY